VFILPVIFLRLPVSAASGIALSSSVQISFPTAINFKVKAQSDTNITKLRLHYRVIRQDSANITSEGWAQFSPKPLVDTQWNWDMRKGNLPPGAEVQYWWTAQDESGKTAETEHSTVFFDDNRYKWQFIKEGQIALQWYNGDTSFANALMAAGQEGLKRIQNDTGAMPKGQVRIYIYASSQDLQGAQLFAQKWEGGATFTGYNIIAIGVSPAELDYGKGAVPHELTHWVMGQVTSNNYNAGMPTWLDEGLATYGEGTSSSNYPMYRGALNSAISKNKLISVRSLSSPFSAVSDLAIISYGESNSIVAFLIEKYGKDKMIQLLNVFQEGSTYDNALKKVYGFDQDGLDKLWRQSIGVKTSLSRSPVYALATSAR
jgi:hypothetical protein